MRLIDTDKLQKAIPAEEDNITGMGMTYDEMEAYNDGIDEQWKKIVNAPIVKAIPIEWIEKQMAERESYGDFNTAGAIGYLLLSWEKENEAD